MRKLGSSPYRVTPVAMGCWPIAGITSLDVNDADSIATLHAAVDQGINHFDSAFCYGFDGESEKLIARALRHRSGISVATKCGIEWLDPSRRVTDGRAATLQRQCDISLQRLQTDRIDLYYLHSPDPQIEIEESAEALARIRDAGKAVAIGLCNASIDQIQRFHAVCPLAVVQMKYNLLQRSIEDNVVPWCRENGVAIASYWPLMKGLLAGKIRRNHVFDPRDSRLKYEIFRDPQFSATQTVVDCLDNIARRIDRTVAQVVVNWNMHREGITTVLCGAKRPDQIVETAGAAGWKLDEESLAEIERAVDQWHQETAAAAGGG